MKSVFITGGGGYCGTRLIHELLKKENNHSIKLADLIARIDSIEKMTNYLIK